MEGLETPNTDFPDLKVKPRYNGNIAEVSWKTLTEQNEPLKKYGYAYDPLNRLSAGFYQNETNPTAKEYFEKLDYDLNGNITRLKRSEGLVAGSTTAMMIDNLKYDYTGNKLTKVTDEQTGNSKGYPYFATPNMIRYDNDNSEGNGNMIRHRDKGIDLIEYNYLNLPEKVTGAAGKYQKIYNYAYRADGRKISKSYTRGSEIWSTDYLDGFQYSFYSGPNAPVATSDLKFVPTSEGYYDFVNNSYIYNYTDHLGNVRLSYTDTNKDGIIQPRQYYVEQCDGPYDPFNPPNCISYWKPGEIVEVNNYYPFGLLHNYTATTQNAYQYKYQGQELQETGWYSFKWRNYMPDVGRFFNVDPLSEKYSYQSHYNFSENRVIDSRELEGLEKVQINEEAPILERTTQGLKTFFGGVTNFFSEKFNISREISINRGIGSREIMTLERSAGKSAALGQMGKGLSETMKGSAYALGEVLDRGGEYTSTAALAAAPFTDGTSLVVVGPAEIVSNVGWGIKFGVDLIDSNYSGLLIEGSKKLISTGIGKVSEGVLSKTFKLNPSMTKTEKAIHETVVGGTATVVSKSIESTIDKKTSEK